MATDSSRLRLRPRARAVALASVVLVGFGVAGVVSLDETSMQDGMSTRPEPGKLVNVAPPKGHAHTTISSPTTAPNADTPTTVTVVPPTSPQTVSTSPPLIGAAPSPVDSEDSLGRFRVECALSHRAQVDPIVNPGPAGTASAHMHDFFGNMSTGADSSYASMTTAGTSCGFSSDTAAYWVPSLLDDHDQFIEPERVVVYYRNRPVSYGSTTAFPPDFRMIAGGAQTYPHAYWTCDGQSDGALETRAPAPPDCGSDGVKLHVFFPSCWDGLRLDSPNHRDHVAYAFDQDDGTSTDISDDTCPQSHPVKIPQLDLRVLYPARDGGGYHLADHAALAHADYWNTWDQPSLERSVGDCLRTGKNCEELTD